MTDWMDGIIGGSMKQEQDEKARKQKQSDEKKVFTDTVKDLLETIGAELEKTIATWNGKPQNKGQPPVTFQKEPVTKHITILRREYPQGLIEISADYGNQQIVFLERFVEKKDARPSQRTEYFQVDISSGKCVLKLPPPKDLAETLLSDFLKNIRGLKSP